MPTNKNLIKAKHQAIKKHFVSLSAAQDAEGKKRYKYIEILEIIGAKFFLTAKTVENIIGQLEEE